jgi:hypothetical protein
VTDVIRSDAKETPHRRRCAHGTPRDPFRGPRSALARNLNRFFPRIACLRNRTRPSWHGSGYPLGGAPVLSRFGARETTTAAIAARDIELFLNDISVVR